MTFNINSQQASVINNVAGDQYNTITSAAEANLLLMRLRRMIEGLDLAPDVASPALVQLDEASAELAQPSPAKPTVADRLGKLVHILVNAGALASAGTSLIAPLTAMAGWLGQIGDPILRSLNL